MIEVKKIKEKVELNDMEVNDYDPCRHLYNNNHRQGQIDCSRDCTACGVDDNGRKVPRCGFGIEEY